ncbi:MAG: ADP-ribosylation factor-like protein [Candidatus Hodarchaeota archaeon]
MNPRKIQIFVFGVSKVGKTTLVQYFREKRFIPQAPTIGVSINQLIFSNLTMEFIDVGGQKVFRREWNNYLKQPHILAFVIDASDRDEERMQDGRDELYKLLNNPKVTGVPLLVLINKIDLELRMAKQAVEKYYYIDGIVDRDVAVYEVSAKTGENMDAVLNAMTSMVLKDDAIEYFVSDQIRTRSKELLSGYKGFLQRGNESFKKGVYDEALACFNLAKEIATNLFQLGIVSSGKEYKKLTNLIAISEKELAREEERKFGISQESYLQRLKSRRFYQEPAEQPPSERPPGLPWAQTTRLSSAPPTGLPQSPSLPKPAAGPPGRLTKIPTMPQSQVVRPEIEEEKIKKISIYLFGLDRAGKTTFVEFLKQEKFKNHTPTLGLNIAHIVLGNVKFEFNDLGGQKAFRRAWMTYWKDPDLMVFMVDSTDDRRFQDARDALWSILENPHSIGKPLLVLVNKIDMPGRKPVEMIEEALELNKIQNRTKGTYEISIKSDHNLEKALNFMVSVILKDDDVEKFVSKEMKRLIKNYKQMYDAYLAEAKSMEKSRNFQVAYNRIFKAKLLQEELFKNGMAKAFKQIKKCDEKLKALNKFL